MDGFLDIWIYLMLLEIDMSETMIESSSGRFSKVNKSLLLIESDIVLKLTPKFYTSIFFGYSSFFIERKKHIIET